MPPRTPPSSSRPSAPRRRSTGSSPARDSSPPVSEQLAGRPDLTVGQMADAVEGGAAVGALRELAEQGFVSPPGPS